MSIDQRERIDGYDAAGRLVDVHRWDPRDMPRGGDPVAVRAVIIGDMATNHGAVTARILEASGDSYDVSASAVAKCKELTSGEA